MKCKHCGNPFVRQRPMQRACSVACALELAWSKRAKADRAETKAKLAAIKPRSQWVKEAQAAFNAYIRARDAGRPCVSCGRHHQGQIHAGHYLSTGARPELRFDESNVHGQCQPCNTHLHGNLVLYRTELIRRIGLLEVVRLEGPQAPRKYTVDDLRAIRNEYRARLREMTKVAA